MAAHLFRMIGTVAVDGISKFQHDLSNAERNVQGLSKHLIGLGHSMTKTGAMLTHNLTLPLAVLGGAVIKTGADFDAAITRSLSVVTDATPEMRRQFEDLAITLSKETTFSATELAEAFYYLVTAGIDAETAMQSMEIAAKFAMAGNMELTDATENLTDVVNALGLTTGDTATDLENMAHASDVIVAASTMAEGTIDQFTDALMEAGGMMQTYGVSIEEGTAALAGFALTGLKGQRAGHALMMVIRDMTNAVTNNKGAWDAANISVFDSQGNFNDLTDIIDQLTDHMEGLTHEQRVNALEQLGLNQRTSQYILRLISVNDHIQDYYEKLQDVTGYTDMVAKAAIADFWSQLTILKHHLQAVALILWKSLGPALEKIVLPATLKLVAAINWLANEFDKLPEPIKNVVWFLTAMVFIAGPLLILLGKMFAGIGFLVLWWGKFATVLAVKVLPILGIIGGALKALWLLMLAHPITLVIAAVALLVGAFIHLVHTSGGVGAAFAKMALSVVNFAEKVLSTFDMLSKTPVISELMGLTGLGPAISKALGHVQRLKAGLEGYIQKHNEARSKSEAANTDILKSYKDTSDGIETDQEQLKDQIKKYQAEAEQAQREAQRSMSQNAQNEGDLRKEIAYNETGYKRMLLGEELTTAQNTSNLKKTVALNETEYVKLQNYGKLLNSKQTNQEDLQHAQQIAEQKKQLQAELTRQHNEMSLNRIQQIEVEKQEKIRKAKELGMETSRIHEVYEMKKRQATRQTAWEMAQTVIGMINTLMGEWSRYTSARIQQIQNTAQREITAIQNSKMSETQKQIHIQRIQTQTDAKTRALQRQQARREKALAIFNAIVNGAVAIVKVWGQLGIFGAIMAGVIAAIVAAQVALIAARPIPMAKGGMVKKRKGGVFSQIGEGAEDEVVLPLQTGAKALVDALIEEVNARPRIVQVEQPMNYAMPGRSVSAGMAGTATKTAPSRAEHALGGPVNHWHIGVLVADEQGRGIKELERRMAKYRISENQRKGRI